MNHLTAFSGSGICHQCAGVFAGDHAAQRISGFLYNCGPVPGALSHAQTGQSGEFSQMGSQDAGKILTSAREHLLQFRLFRQDPERVRVQNQSVQDRSAIVQCSPKEVLCGFSGAHTGTQNRYVRPVERSAQPVSCLPGGFFV